MQRVALGFARRTARSPSSLPSPRERGRIEVSLAVLPGVPVLPTRWLLPPALDCSQAAVERCDVDIRAIGGYGGHHKELRRPLVLPKYLPAIGGDGRDGAFAARHIDHAVLLGWRGRYGPNMGAHAPDLFPGAVDLG